MTSYNKFVGSADGLGWRQAGSPTNANALTDIEDALEPRPRGGILDKLFRRVG